MEKHRIENVWSIHTQRLSNKESTDEPILIQFRHKNGIEVKIRDDVLVELASLVQEDITEDEDGDNPEEEISGNNNVHPLEELSNVGDVNSLEETPENETFNLYFKGSITFKNGTISYRLNETAAFPYTDETADVYVPVVVVKKNGVIRDESSYIEDLIDIYEGSSEPISIFNFQQFIRLSVVIYISSDEDNNTVKTSGSLADVTAEMARKTADITVEMTSETVDSTAEMVKTPQVTVEMANRISDVTVEMADKTHMVTVGVTNKTADVPVEMASETANSTVEMSSTTRYVPLTNMIYMTVEMASVATHFLARPLPSLELFPSDICGKTGFVTLRSDDKPILINEDNLYALVDPMIGIWVYADQVDDPLVWAACVRYVSSCKYKKRILLPPKHFLTILINPTSHQLLAYACTTKSRKSLLEFDLATGSAEVIINEVEKMGDTGETTKIYVYQQPAAPDSKASDKGETREIDISSTPLNLVLEENDKEKTKEMDVYSGPLSSVSDTNDESEIRNIYVYLKPVTPVPPEFEMALDSLNQLKLFPCAEIDLPDTSGLETLNCLNTRMPQIDPHELYLAVTERGKVISELKKAVVILAVEVLTDICKKQSQCNKKREEILNIYKLLTQWMNITDELKLPEATFEPLSKEASVQPPQEEIQPRRNESPVRLSRMDLPSRGSRSDTSVPRQREEMELPLTEMAVHLTKPGMDAEENEMQLESKTKSEFDFEVHPKKTSTTNAVRNKPIVQSVDQRSTTKPSDQKLIVQSADLKPTTEPQETTVKPVEQISPVKSVDETLTMKSVSNKPTANQKPIIKPSDQEPTGTPLNDTPASESSEKDTRAKLLGIETIDYLMSLVKKEQIQLDNLVDLLDKVDNAVV